MDIVCLAIY